MMRQGNAVVVVADEGLGGVAVLGEAILARGLTPVLLTGAAAPAQLARWRHAYADIRVLPDPYDVDALVHAATGVAAVRPLAALFSCCDGLVLPAARAAAALGLAHPTLRGLARARNKYAARAAARRAGLCSRRKDAMEASQVDLTPAAATTRGIRNTSNAMSPRTPTSEASKREVAR